MARFRVVRFATGARAAIRLVRRFRSRWNAHPGFTLPVPGSERERLRFIEAEFQLEAHDQELVPVQAAWAALAPAQLRRRARAIIEDGRNQIGVSTVTFWEVALRFALGKLELAGVLPNHRWTLFPPMRKWRRIGHRVWIWFGDPGYGSVPAIRVADFRLRCGAS